MKRFCGGHVPVVVELHCCHRSIPEVKPCSSLAEDEQIPRCGWSLPVSVGSNHGGASAENDRRRHRHCYHLALLLLLLLLLYHNERSLEVGLVEHLTSAALLLLFQIEQHITQIDPFDTRP